MTACIWIGGVLASALLGGMAPEEVPAGPGAFEVGAGIEGVRHTGDGVDEELLAKVWEEARADLLVGLETHAEWCNSAKLFAERDKVYRRILELHPDHQKARRGLGYRQDRDGNWEDPDPKRRPTKNYDKSNLKSAERRLTEALAPYTECLYDFVDAHAKELSSAQLRRIVAEILSMDPEDERAHALLGHVKVEGAKKGEHLWVLVETATAKERRKELLAHLTKLLRNAPQPTTVAPSAQDSGIDIDWKVLRANDRIRVVGTVSGTEADKMLMALVAAEGYFNQAVGAKVRLADGLTVYLLGDAAEAAALIDGHPAPMPKEREFLKTLDGGGISGCEDIGHWAKTGDRRIDGVVRIALGNLFTRAFNITTRHAWVYEGFGLYLTYSIVQTRLNWFALPSGQLLDEEENALRSRLIHPDTNWMQEAYTLLQADEHPSFRDVLGKRMDQLTSFDLLLSYVLAAFLVEAHPTETPGILGQIGSGGDSGLVLCDALGVSFGELEVRILRWLSERK